MPSQAANFLDYYLDSETDAPFAVMLRGPWGAGKSHFIKNYLDKRTEGLQVKKRHHYLYASLYGITSTSQITDQFFSQLHPALNSKALKILGTVASRALNGYVGTDVNSGSENKSILQLMATKLDGRILVFDDLERCALPIGEVMGFINSFVEHEEMKVIVLANEEDIPEDQKETYTKQKEKLIGKTIEVKSDPNEVLNKLISDIRNPASKDIVSRERDCLLETFLSSKNINYRNLRAVIFEFERVVNVGDERLQASDEALKQLLLYMIATGNEYRSGSLSTENLSALPTTEYYRGLGLNGKSNSPQAAAFEELKSRYTQVKWSNPVIPPIILAELYKSGLIDIQAINEVLGQHPLVVGYSEAPAWRQLWSWTDLSKTEYLIAREKLVLQLLNKEHTHPGLLLHTAGIAIMLKDFGDDLLNGIDAPRYFAEYLRDLTSQGKMLPDRTTFGFMSLAYAGLGYPCHESPEFQFIQKAAKIATEIACAKQMKEVASGYIERLASSTEHYSSLYEHGFAQGNYADSAFLQHLPIEEFAALLIIDSSPNDRLFASLCRRYELLQQRSHNLRDEFEWLHRLKSYLEGLAAKESPPYQHLQELRIRYYFEQIENGTGEKF